MVLKNVRAKADAYWTRTKKFLAALSCWGLVFSLVTICRLGVAFDYDDTLVFSTPALSRAFANTAQPFSEAFWSVVNQSYDLEKPKLIPYVLAWMFRVFGFRVAILTARPAVDAEPLKKEWRHLVGRGQFHFTSRENKHQYLQSGNYVLFFGDSDSDIQQARRARVFAIRVKRSPKSLFKDDYHPGTMGELVIPLSEY
ncbi:MAG: hypothetical protein HY921_11185 [Elusimicrobia bacterium]|nr:hypothetical protein [Elusimicrobiota bacterium]